MCGRGRRTGKVKSVMQVQQRSIILKVLVYVILQQARYIFGILW